MSGAALPQAEPKCLCVSDLCIDCTAAELGCKPRWLRDNYRRFEREEYGIEVRFTPAQRDKIRAACRVTPPAEQQPAAEVSAAQPGRIPITQLRPVQRGRRATG